MIHTLTENETILPDHYPLYAGYVYIMDNKFARSNVICTVAELKLESGIKEIRRCDLFSHYGAKIGDAVYSSLYKI